MQLTIARLPTLRGLSVLLCLTWACTASAPPSTDGGSRATLRGTVHGDAPDELVLRGGPAPISDGWSVPRQDDQIAVAVGAGGEFRVELEIGQPTYYRLAAGSVGLNVLLAPGADTVLELGSPESSDLQESGEEIRFAGDLALENQRLFEIDRGLMELERSFGRNYRSLCALDPEEFENRLRERQQPLEESQGKFLEENPGLSPAFVRRARGELDTWFAMPRVVYPSLHHRITGARLELPQSFYEDTSGSLLDREDLLASPRYMAFLDSLLLRVSRGEQQFLDTELPAEKLRSRYDAIRQLPLADATRDHLLGQMFENFETSYGPRDWRPVLEALERDQPGHAVAERFRPVLDRELAERERPSEIVAYRSVDGVDLEAHVFMPEEAEAGSLRSAYVFFHGGGWAIGTPEWGYANGERMAERGMVAISFEYRLADVHGTGMFAAVSDVQAAVAWTRERAEELRIDPKRVVVAGFSAGGHLAATTAMLDNGDLGESARPDALILHSSSYDLSKSSFFSAMTGGRAEAVSLLHQARPGLVPTLLLHGDRDHLAPEREFQSFVARMEELDNDFEYRLFEGVGHFFRNDAARQEVVETTDDFLRRRGFLPAAGS